jgi:hypothetical protein
MAGFFRSTRAELANAGTLLAFIATAACMMILRKRAPELPRVFRRPQPMLIGSLAIGGLPLPHRQPAGKDTGSIRALESVRYRRVPGYGRGAACSARRRVTSQRG